MTMPTTPARVGRPRDLSKLAKQAMRVDGPKWLETLRRDAAMGDGTAIGILLNLALQPPPSKPPT